MCSSLQNRDLKYFWPHFEKQDAWYGCFFSFIKTAYISLIIGVWGLACEANLLEIMGGEASDVVRFDLGSLLQGQTRIAKLKNAYNSLIITPRGLGYETYL